MIPASSLQQCPMITTRNLNTVFLVLVYDHTTPSTSGSL
jgi:hypothetical protein